MKKSSLFLILALLAGYVGTEFFTMGQRALSPESVPLFLKQHPDTLIVDVREDRSEGKFSDSYALPLSQLERRHIEIPADRPILLHCAHGNSVKRAYRFLRHTRPDIQRLYYISGTPIFDISPDAAATAR